MKAPAPLGRRILSALAGVAVAALLATAGVHGYRLVAAQPLKRVVYAGDVDRLPQADLDALAHAVQAAPEGVSMAAVRDAARKVPWVREATVRRRFPDTAEITFEAHEAMARWNDAQLVSARGEVFTAPDAAKLPRLRGPDASAPQVVALYPLLAKALAPLADPVAELRLTPRGAWQAVLASGFEIELGRHDMQARAERFAAAWAQVAQRGTAARHADLRYPNGFALRTARTTPAR